MKPEVIGEVRVAAKAFMDGDVKALGIHDANTAEDKISLLKGLLRAFDPLVSCHELQFASGHLVVDLYGAATGEGAFDVAAFLGFARTVQAALDSWIDVDESDIPQQASLLAERTNRPVDEISKLLRHVLRQRSVLTVIDDLGLQLTISPPPRSAMGDHVDVDVDNTTPRALVTTNIDVYVVDGELALALKPGDRVLPIDSGPQEQYRCILADSAVPVNYELDFDGVSSVASEDRPTNDVAAKQCL